MEISPEDMSKLKAADGQSLHPTIEAAGRAMMGVGTAATIRTSKSADGSELIMLEGKVYQLKRIHTAILAHLAPQPDTSSRVDHRLQRYTLKASEWQQLLFTPSELFMSTQPLCIDSSGLRVDYVAPGGVHITRWLSEDCTERIMERNERMIETYGSASSSGNAGTFESSSMRSDGPPPSPLPFDGPPPSLSSCPHDSPVYR